jgi:hypothetical protein
MDPMHRLTTCIVPHLSHRAANPIGWSRTDASERGADAKTRRSAVVDRIVAGVRVRRLRRSHGRIDRDELPSRRVVNGGSVRLRPVTWRRAGMPKVLPCKGYHITMQMCPQPRMQRSRTEVRRVCRQTCVTGGASMRAVRSASSISVTLH